MNLDVVLCLKMGGGVVEKPVYRSDMLESTIKVHKAFKSRLACFHREEIVFLQKWTTTGGAKMHAWVIKRQSS